MEDSNKKTELLQYIWNIFSIFGGNFSYTDDEMHDIVTQKIKVFDKYFVYNVSKSDGTQVQCRRDISRLSEVELKSLGGDIVKMAKDSYNGFVLPSLEEYQKDIAHYKNYAEKINKLTKIFL